MITITNKIVDIIKSLGYEASTTAVLSENFIQDFSDITDGYQIVLPINYNLGNGLHNDIGENYTKSFNQQIAIIVGRPISGTDAEKQEAINDRMIELDTMYNTISKAILDATEHESGAMYINSNSDEISHSVEIEYQSGALMSFQIEYKI